MRYAHLLGPVALTSLLTLGACGGGGGDSPSSPPPPPPPPATTGVGIGGTAANGAPIAGGAVSVACASGSGQATTAANGSYSVTITSGVAPCLVQVTTSGASPTTYYSLVAAGSANPATVNITPLTTLMTAQVLGVDPAAAVFPNVQARMTATNIATARADLTAALNGRVDLSGIDPIGTAFVPGDATAQKLVDLQTTLTAARLSEGELSAALIANAGAPYAIRSYLAPASIGCRGLRSLPMALVSPFGFDIVTVDAVNLTSTQSGGAVETLTDNGGCNFTSSGSGDTVLVSPASVSAVRFDNGGGQFSIALGLPLQTVPVADLAGTWNYVGYGRDPSVGGSVLTPEHGTLTLNSAGTATSGTLCSGLNTCAPDPANFTLTPNAQGGFNLGDVGGVSLTDRVFVYRAPSGTMTMIFSIDDPDNRGFYVATQQVRLALPAVGQVVPFSQISIGSAGTASAVTTNVSTTTAVDSAGDGSFTRTLSDGHAETILLNNPRDGMRHRIAGSSPGNNGTPVSYNAVVQMRPAGAGMTLSLSTDPAQNFFTATIDSPVP